MKQKQSKREKEQGERERRCTFEENPAKKGLSSSDLERKTGRLLAVEHGGLVRTPEKAKEAGCTPTDKMSR